MVDATISHQEFVEGVTVYREANGIVVTSLSPELREYMRVCFAHPEWPGFDLEAL